MKFIIKIMIELLTEPLAAILTLICVLLLNMKNKIGWSVGIVAVVLYLFVFYTKDLFGQMFLQVVFIGQSIYGWWLWNKDGDGLKVMNGSNHIYEVIGIWVGFMVLAWLFSISGNSSIGHYEAITIRSFDFMIVGLALFANHLLNKKILQSWYLWIFVDILSIGLFVYLELWWTVVLYILLLTNAVNASIEWKKTLNYVKK